MKVLIVHDRSEVGNEIADVVNTAAPGTKIIQVEDAMGARDAMTSDYFDLLILDLTIAHVAQSGEVNYLAAEGLLDEVFAPSRILTPGNILGITREPEALRRVATKISSHLMSIVQEDDEGAWRTDLADRVQYVLLSQRARSVAWLTKYDYDLFILTALDKELRPLRAMFELLEAPGLQGVYEFVFTDRTGKVRRGACTAIGRAGQPSAASEAQGLICQLRPKLAIMIGFCGGVVPDKVNLGDIIIGESAIDWDFGKWKPSAAAAKLYSRPEPLPIRGTRVHLLARSIVDEGVTRIDGLKEKLFADSAGEITNPSIRLAPFASGSAVIGAADVLQSVRELNEGVGAVDMESYGFYYACNYSRAAKPEFVCIKAVADDCSPTKDDRLHEACCNASAEVARHIVMREWTFDG